MIASVHIQTGAKEPIQVLLVDIFGRPLTGDVNTYVKIRRLSDGFYYDWSDETFKAAGLVNTLLERLSEVSATTSPGEYFLDSAAHPDGWDTSKITNPVADDIYSVTVVQLTGAASNVPQVGEIKVGRWVDRIDAPVSSLADPAEVYTEAERVVRDYGLDHLVAVNPGIVPPAANTYVRQILDKEDQVLSLAIVKQSYAYDPIAEVVTGQVWTERGNAVITAPISVSVTWFDADGAAMFTMTNSAPDAQGVFKVSKAAPGLVKNRSYYAVALVNLPSGIVTSAKGAFTIG